MVCTAGGWVQMRLGVWESADGLAWSRQRSLRASTGKENSGQHAASWGPFFVHDPTNDTWVLSYVGYRSAGSNRSGWLEVSWRFPLIPLQNCPFPPELQWQPRGK
jgi:hypothetical protein